MISYEEALDILDNATALASTQLSLGEACGHVSAQNISSDIHVPLFANSAMDGFAVSSDLLQNASKESPVTLPVSASVAAGDALASAGGGCCEIMTGACVPDGYDAVVKVEDVSIHKTNKEGRPEEVIFTQRAKKKQNIRNAGEDFMPGDEIITSGSMITPMHIMALAGVGQKQIAVIDSPKITIISTGKEVVDNADAPLSGSQIHNSNSPYLMAALGEMGISAQYAGIIHDEPEAFERMVKDAQSESDIIISTGAVSMGRHDFIPNSLRKLGADILFHKIAIRPGKPMLYARLSDGTHYFGLPGNPVSAAVGLRFFVVPLLRKLQGLPAENVITARLLMPAHKKQGLRFFSKAHVSVAQGGKLQMEILKGQESFKTQPLLKANCWASFAPEQTGQEVGAAIDVYPFTPGKWCLQNVTYG
jgi:molybdopterin molybdotransferase